MRGFVKDWARPEGVVAAAGEVEVGENKGRAVEKRRGIED